MDEPVLISLTLRWFGWVVALVVIIMEAAPPINLRNAPLVLGVTGIQLLVMSAYPRYIRPWRPPSMERIAPLLWPTLDMGFALWSIAATGGWDSPFYHFALTVVLAPSLRYGLMGALISSTLFSAFYIVVVKHTLEGFGPAYIADGQAKPDLVSTPLNPLMLGLYAAFLGEVLKKLHREMKRSELLAAENERARMARDIHDGVSQTLFMLAMSLETGEVLAEKEGASKTTEHLKKITPVAQKALIELRNAMYSAESLAQGEQSLEEAIAQLGRDYHSATGLVIECTVEEGFKCTPQLGSVLFRMTQEALSNACQHSGGDTIQVSLGRGELVVRDNGKGFLRDSIKPGRGLKNLENRALEAGIEQSIESGREGTIVTFRWSEVKG